MSMTDNLKKLISEQKSLTSELEKGVLNFESNDIIAENDSLKIEIEKYKKQLEETIKSNAKLSDENKNLKNTLYEQLYNEKITILRTVNKKVDSYYKSSIAGGLNRLNEFELSSMRRINKMITILRENRVSAEDEIYKKLEELKQMLNYKVTIARQEFSTNNGAFSLNKQKEFENLHSEGISEEELKNAIKKNNVESIIGLNILNKVGIFFLIIGVIAAAQFTYFQLPLYMKGIFSFIIGVIVLIVGEILNRKKANVFSLGITSGGVAILYAALALSYFGLEIIGMYQALAICVIITVIAFLLSQRYNSQTIATFALLGGYMPLFSIAGSKALVFSAMGYFIILNLLALVVSYNKKWRIMAFVGFGLSVLGTGYIMQVMLSKRISNEAFGIEDLTTLSYIVLSFLIYTLIPITSTIYSKIKFKTPDIILLGINTFISSILLYFAFYSVNLSNYTGILAIIFAAIYLGLGKFLKSKLPEEKWARTLFYLTGFAFVVLIIPFQFDKMWLSLGWLVEGVFLVVYGILRDEKSFRRYGFIACALCLGTFLFIDVATKLLFLNMTSSALEFNALFTYKYFAMTLGSIIILASYMYKKQLIDNAVLVLKYCAASNLWVFMLYIINNELVKITNQLLEGSMINKKYIIAALSIALSLLIAYSLPRIKILSDYIIKMISISIYSFTILWLFSLNASISPVASRNVPMGINILGTIILIILGLISLIAMIDLVKYFVIERNLGIEWYPLIVSGYFVIILTQNLISQYHLQFNNLALSIIYVIVALSWIVFGFIKRYAFIRRFGLGLAITAIAKLFLIDLAFLSQGNRIISYFVFGIVLLAISFVYQYFNKRLEIKDEVISEIIKVEK